MRVGSWWTGVALAVWASTAAGEVCQNCLLGVFDDQAMTRRTGSVSIFQVKSVYLGMELDADVSIDELTFDATYPTGFTVVDVTAFVSGATYDVGGNSAAVHWPACVSGTRVLFRVRVLTTTSVRNGLVQLHNVVARGCNVGTPESWPLPSTCYVINPSGGTPPCVTSTTPATWTIVKELFRTIDSR